MTNNKFWTNLEETDWYDFVHQILKYAAEIAQVITTNESVLVRDQEGTDFTSQIVSIAEILIDPYYRTIKGFGVLIEKDWISCGYQFGIRNGIYYTEIKEDLRSPIFLLWLDCVHQLLDQFPNAFEFNHELLLFLAQSSNSNLYGTFLFNNEKERSMFCAMDKTASVWSDVLTNVEKFKNLFFSYDNRTAILYPNYALYNLRFWDDFFMNNSNYVTNDVIYLNDNSKITFKNQQDFFNWQKIQDDKKARSIEENMNSLTNALKDIYKTTKGTEVFDSFNDYTQNFLKQYKNHI